MTFWNDVNWQAQTADAIQNALVDLDAELRPLNLRDGAWTPRVMRAIGPLHQGRCGSFGVACAFKGSTRSNTGWYTGGEFVFDLTWLVQARNPDVGEFALTIGLPLVLECEWLDWSDVPDDFDKLLLARAGLRVMIFQKRKDTPDNWEDLLFKRADAYADGARNDAWLLCYWDNGFTFRRRIGRVTK